MKKKRPPLMVKAIRALGGTIPRTHCEKPCTGVVVNVSSRLAEAIGVTHYQCSKCGTQWAMRDHKE